MSSAPSEPHSVRARPQPRSERFCAAVLAGDPAALEALATLRMLPSGAAVALLSYLTEMPH